MTTRALVPLSSEELQDWDDKIVALRPELEDAPIKVRWATLILAHTHGLDPLQKEIIPIKVGGKWQPYITLDGARGNADRRGLDYQRVLSPLSDKWTEMFFGLTAEETRQSMDLKDDDMVWICAIYVNGKAHPFVHLGVVGPTFHYGGQTAHWRMAAIRAERPALLAACRLPYTAGVDSAEFDANGKKEPEQEPVVEGEIRPIVRLKAVGPEAEANDKVARERIAGGFPHPLDSETEFLARICEQIPYFKHPAHATNTLAKLELEYNDHPQAEASLFEILNDYATRRADEKAAAEGGEPPERAVDAGQLDPEQATMPW
jgi:hypothetical protein